MSSYGTTNNTKETKETKKNVVRGKDKSNQQKHSKNYIFVLLFYQKSTIQNLQNRKI